MAKNTTTRRGSILKSNAWKTRRGATSAIFGGVEKGRALFSPERDHLTRDCARGSMNLDRRHAVGRGRDRSTDVEEEERRLRREGEEERVRETRLFLPDGEESVRQARRDSRRRGCWLVAWFTSRPCVWLLLVERVRGPRQVPARCVRCVARL